MRHVEISAQRIGTVTVLVLPDTPHDSVSLSEALIAEAPPAPAHVVLDLRQVTLLAVATARVVMDFAGSVVRHGGGCSFVMSPSGVAAEAVLDLFDPEHSISRHKTFAKSLADAAKTPRTTTSGFGSAVNTLAFDSTDLGATEDFLSASYAPMRIGSTTGAAGAHITRVATGSVSIDRLDLAFEMTYDVQPLGQICLCDIHEGTIEGHRVDGWREAEAFGAGELFSFSPPDRGYAGRICRARYDITMFDPALLEQIAGEPVRLLDHHAVDAGSARHVRRAIAHLRDDVLAVPGIGDNELVVATATQYLAAAVLNAFPTTASGHEPDLAGRDAHAGALQRAVAFIDANADRPIGLADIAAAARVSPRSVEQAFQHHLGTTPMAHLRRVRLDGARAELRASGVDDTAVGRIATRWGYHRPAAFAAHYLATYGVTPQQTLRDDEPARRTLRPAADHDRLTDAVLGQFEALTGSLLDAATTEAALDHVVRTAREVIPGADLVSVTLRGSAGHLVTAASTSGAAVELDQVQEVTGRGPGLDVVAPDESGQVICDDLAADERWPEFSAAAVAQGRRALVCTGLHDATGALTVYSSRPDGLTSADARMAVLLATHGSLALAHARLAEKADQRQGELRRAIESRDIIGQAKGILMHRQGISADEAFYLLRTTSQELNTKLVEIARTVAARRRELGG
ncbi:ANTAR domain-containing protein [Lentzea sp. NPDC003310]|uniref:ANTAR domain-containing protein n=1 Tax=Lentzea sp. NPDC003310 TaxID=3154447 RepID=UPI0033BC0885